jgi:hypothetical protein
MLQVDRAPAGGISVINKENVWLGRRQTTSYSGFRNVPGARNVLPARSGARANWLAARQKQGKAR